MSKVTGRGRGSMMGKHQLAMPLLVAVLVAGAAACNAASPSASPSGETATADLVTEEVEPGVKRIRSDGAGHDLEERHPTTRYDMDNVYVTPDGTVWVSSSYSGTDNEANPPGGLVWRSGSPRRPNTPASVSASPANRTTRRPQASRALTLPTPKPGTSSARDQRRRACTGWDLLGGGRRRRRERRSVPHHARVTHRSARHTQRPVPQGDGSLLTRVAHRSTPERIDQGLDAAPACAQLDEAINSRDLECRSGARRRLLQGGQRHRRRVEPGGRRERRPDREAATRCLSARAALRRAVEQGVVSRSWDTSPSRPRRASTRTSSRPC